MQRTPLELDSLGEYPTLAAPSSVEVEGTDAETVLLRPAGLAADPTATAQFVPLRDRPADPDLSDVAWLLILQGARSLAQLVPLHGNARGRVRLGLDESCDIPLTDPYFTVSREHAEIRFEPRSRRYLLFDLHSSNGTFVRLSQSSTLTQVAQSFVLTDGCLVCLGRQAHAALLFRSYY